MTRLKLMLLYGGKSGEHEISLQSAASVLTNLDTTRYEVLPVGIDKTGCFYLNDAATLIKEHPESLPPALPKAKKIPSLIKDGTLALSADVVFPVMHGPLYEDGALQGLLEMAGVAYVGCDVLSSAMCMDKAVARQLAEVEGVKAIRFHRLPYTASQNQDKTWCETAARELGFPLFVKPCCLGSSVGIHRVEDMPSLLKAVQDARRYDTAILVEEYIEGREIELAVLEHNGLEGLPDVSMPGEIKTGHKDGFYSYAAKYTECEQLELCIPAKLTPAMTRKLQVAAAEIFMRLRCRGLARVDFFVQDGTEDIYFNEINTMPGFTTVSMFPKLWEASGLSYSALLDRLVSEAQVRQTTRKALITDYASLSHDRG